MALEFRDRFENGTLKKNKQFLNCHNYNQRMSAEFMHPTYKK